MQTYAKHYTGCFQCSWGSRRTRTRSVLRQPAQTSLICPPVQVLSSLSSLSLLSISSLSSLSSLLSLSLLSISSLSSEARRGYGHALSLSCNSTLPTPLGVFLGIIVNEKPLNFENTTSSILFILLINQRVYNFYMYL